MKTKAKSMNILVTLDQNYIPPLKVMLFSLIHYHPQDIEVYLLHQAIPKEALAELEAFFACTSLKIHPIQVDDQIFVQFPTTDRYPYAMYYRLFAAKLLPQTIDKILYLDPDIVIKGNLDDLYQIDMDRYYFGAATHVDWGLSRINQLRLNYENGIYVNSGVLLMNLKELRQSQDELAIGQYIDKFKPLLFLPDQDVLSAMYPDKILEIDATIYNMTERIFLKNNLFQREKGLQWIDDKCKIIHYIGRNKPWKTDYFGDFDRYYHEAVGFMKGYRYLANLNNKQIRQNESL